jgi:hypothetical protein
MTSRTARTMRSARRPGDPIPPEPVSGGEVEAAAQAAGRGLLEAIPNSLLARSTPMPERSALGQGGSSNVLVSRQIAERGSATADRRQIQRDDANPAVGPAVHSATGGAVDLNAVVLAFTLPGRKVLSSSASRNLTTTAETTITLRVTATDVQLSMSPSLYIDAQWPAQNMALYSVRYTFADHRTEVGVSAVNDEWGDGLIDVTDTARESITELMNGIFRGTPISPGRPIGAGPPPPSAPYNPMTDTDLQGTAERIQMAFSQLPSTGGSDVGSGDVGRVSAGAEIVVRAAQVAGDGPAKVHIAAGTAITVMANGGATAAQLQGGIGAGTQAAANAANITSIGISSNGIVVKKDGEDVISLTSITIHRGGNVTLDRFELLGSAREAANTERSVWWLIGTGLNVAQGAPPALAGAMAAEDPNTRAQIVPGIARDMVERALNQAFTSLLAQHGRDIPGVDLGQVLGVPGAPVPAGGP